MVPVYIYDTAKNSYSEDSASSETELILPDNVAHHIADDCIRFISGLSNNAPAAGGHQTLILRLSDDWDMDISRAEAFIEFGNRQLQLARDEDAACFFTSFELTPGPNNFYIFITDPQKIYACSSLWTVWGTDTRNLADQEYLVILDKLDLDNFPQVSLDVTVSHAGDPVEGLTEKNFIVSNAGRMIDIAAAEKYAGYRLQFTDICCGRRPLCVYAQDSPITSRPLRAGVSPIFYYGTNRALLVGINEYPDPADALQNCVNDLHDMQAVLQNDIHWQSDDSTINILTDTNATRDNVLGELSALVKSSNPWDLLVFFFSGHGSGEPADPQTQQYICTSENPPAWISVADLAGVLSGLTANGPANAFVFLDACHSGNFIGKAAGLINQDIRIKYLPLPQSLKDTAQGHLAFTADLKDLGADNIVVLSAAAGDEAAYDVGALSNGAFSYYLTQGLGLDHDTLLCQSVPQAPGNLDHNNWLASEEIYDFLFTNITAAFNQSPQLGDGSPGLEDLFLNQWVP